MLDDYDKTAHLDGFRATPDERDGLVRVVVRLVTGGVPAADFEPVVLYEAPKTQDAEAAQELVLIAAQGLCSFLNAGGKRNDLWVLADKFTSDLPELIPEHRLVSVLPPPGGNMVIWQRKDGTYLKVQEGGEGFTEQLSELELREVLDAPVGTSPETDWP